MNKSPYETLGLTSSASQDDIKNAYRNLAKKYHPDLNPGKKDAEKKFKEINAANELIGTPEARAKFDRGETEAQQAHTSQSTQGGSRSGPFYHQTQEGGGRYTSSFEGMDDEILQSIFGRMGGQSKRTRTDAPGEDALYQMEIDFKDAVLGAEREITLPSGKRLMIKIPAGVESGTKLRFAGQGGAGSGQASAGDAYIQLNVRPSKLFKREQNDLEIELPISLSEAVLGSEVKVPTIDGSVLLKIPPQVNSGQRLRISGKGVPITGTTQRGNQFVILKILNTPVTIDEEFKQAIKSWSDRQPYDPRSGWIGLKGEV
jgi:DnaJ-class molecular chaperone